MATNPLKVLSLGGLGEIGRNLTVLEYEGSMIIVDVGLMFPEHDMLGVDLVIPDIDYVVENESRLLGIIITHGHEDHHGALPYLLRELRAPTQVFASKLASGLIDVRLKENNIRDMAELHVVEPGSTQPLGPFNVEFIHVAHSIPDALAIAVDTPVGMVIHTGEYKLDLTPHHSEPTDLQRFADLGRDGVLLLMADSTNADRPGTTASEQVVSDALDDLFTEAKGRVIVSSFASNISRVGQVIEMANRYGRRVGVTGRSMINSVNMSIDLGYLPIKKEDLLEPHQFDDLPPEEVCVICTGSQGEPYSALVRMAKDEHRQVTIREGDTVIVSATTIPGNEELVSRTLNNLYRRGARVYYPPLSNVHVSGHASQEELKLLLSLIKPQYFMPIQGEYRHLVLHGELAQQVGIPKENTIITEAGIPIYIHDDEWWTGDPEGGDYIYVDGLGVGDVGSVVLRDRRRLAEDGFIVVVIVVEHESGKLAQDPFLLSRGFVYMAESEDLIDQATNIVRKAVTEAGSHPVDTQRDIQRRLERFFYNKTKRHPMIFTIVNEV